ncbi:MAG TPA: glycosyltransferase [Bacteroidales bacterium]|jgi:glycosyltransferase involved in cell wall biosynthesis|nr:glycosyltransferase [Bacteroidales bacterium]HQN24308.1 glycosyltransferase [Bacteroidales bacterium]HQP78946.1 glycosyltransferase [Bacteroidales bacterium]
MRIAYLSTFYPFRGGIAQFNANLYEELAKKHQVRAFTFSRQYPSLLFPGKTQYVTERDKAKVVESTALLDTINPFTYFSTAKIIASLEPDVVVMKYWMSYLAPSLGMVAKLLRKKGIKVVTILDNVIPHERKFFDKPFSRWFLKQNSGCIAMSSSVLDDMLSLTPDKPYILQPHPLYDHFGAKMEKEKACERLGIKPDKKNLLFFGLIRDYKGLDLLIEAMKHLDDSYRLIIAGESYGSFDKYQEQIKNLIAKNSSLAERIVVFNRYIDDDEVPAFFSASDLCVLPYKSATQSGITAISLHFEIPVIATRTGGLAETVEEPGIGIIADEISAEGIVRAIESYFTHPDKSLFTENIRKAKETMSWTSFAKALVDFCKSL